MNTELDPIIARKLDDFRTRRRNLILLRGLCSGVLSFLGTFVLIALLDYLSEGRMSSELRSWLSIVGYCLVLVLIWKTCLGPLLQLPSAKKLARLLEQSSPELKEDLLSAVELGVSKQGSPDSDTFRKLVQKQASSKASKLDIKSVLPLGTLKYWLRGTAGLIALTIALLQIPDFGSDFKLLMKRAIMPGSNLPPVTFFDVRILTPDENVTRTPSNEPLRFVASVIPKKEGKIFKEVTLETRTLNDIKNIILTKRSQEKYFVDYNVGNEKFEYRILVDQAPQTEWRQMDVGTRPFIENFKKNYKFPEYSELAPVEKLDDHGDLKAWEGSTVELSMISNQPLKSGRLEFQWLEKPREIRELQPEMENNILHTSIRMTHPGTYRVKNLINEKLGWEGRPSSNFEITVVPDLAPSVQWVEPTERKLLVAPTDLLSFSALAQDDLGLARVEYLIKKNRKNWTVFPIPNLLDPRGLNTAAIVFNLDLLLHKLKPGDQAFLKLRARDLKGTSVETDAIELSVVSRDFDLSSIRLLEKKRIIISHFDSVKDELTQMQKGLQQSLREFQQNKDSKKILLEKVNQLEEELLILGKEAYEDNLQVLLGMPRGIDSYETSMMGKAFGQVVLSSANLWVNAIREIDAESESNRIRSKSHELTKIINMRKGMVGNFRNIAQDLLNQHAEIIAVSYLESLQQRQRELIEDNQKRKPLPFLARRQEVALNQWDPISEALSHSLNWQRSSTLKRNKTKQLELNQKIENGVQSRDNLKKQIEEWNKSIDEILRSSHQKLAVKSRESFRHKAEELYWNLKRNHFYWDDLKRAWEQILRTNSEEEDLVSKLLGKLEVLISETMMYSKVEQSKKDQNSLFVKDAGQTGRALIKMQKDIRDANQDTSESYTSLYEKSKRLGDSFQILLLQHHLIGSANQVIYFMRQENGNFSKWKGAACARQWGRVETVWKPILDEMIRLQVSKEAIDIMRRLPNQDYRKKVVKEMQSRVKSIHHEHQSVLVNADLVFKDLQKIISLIKEEVLEARTLLDQVAPTLPELARELAKETEEQKNKILEAQKDKGSSLIEIQEELAKLNEQQQDIGNSVENFAQALRQEANIQNLLDEEGREIARDSDDAASLVEESEREIEENLIEASQAQDANDMELATKETIQEQENLIDELNLIAEHFENLKNKESVAETRQELREKEQELETAEEIEKQYAQAERLADLAKLTAEELLEELEEELENNDAMQRELSDLAEDTVENANEKLEDALNQEEELIEELEKENKELQKQKQEIAKQLKDLAKEAQKLAEQKIESVEEEAEKAKADTLSKKAEDLQEALAEEARQTEEAIQSKPDTQELKDATLALADSLEETSEDLQEIADDLEEQAKLNSDSAFKRAKDAENVAREKQVQAETLEKEADQLQGQAQQAQQDSLKKQIEEEKAKEEVLDAMDALEEAEELASQSPNDPALQENLQKAKSELTQQQEEFQKAQESTFLAEEQTNQLTKEADLAKAIAENAQQSAENSKQAAEEANALAEALTNPNLQDSVKEASKKGNELAEQVAEEADNLKLQAEELAEALDLLTEQAKGNAELLAKAEQTQEELAEDLFNTSQELARAARHEERLENPSASEALENIADSIEDTALDAFPKAAQSLENQALANELEDLADAAEDLAKDLSSNETQGDEEIAGELNALAEETKNLIEENPSFADLQDQAEKFSEQASQTEEELSQLAEDLMNDAQSAREVANSSSEAAEQAKADMQTAQSEASEAAGKTENLAKASEQAAQALQNGTGTQQEANSAAEKASNATENAEQLDSIAGIAEEAFEKAQEQAQADYHLANESIAEAEQASKQAEEAAGLASAAEKLLDQFSETPPSTELANADLPGAGVALNEVQDALENQLDTLENLQSGESSTPSSFTAGNELEENPAGQNSEDSPESFSSTEDAFDNSTPFSDSEVSEVLAQTLDTLDQALFSTKNPFAESADSFPSESTSSGEPIKSAFTEPSTPGESQSSESFPSAPGELIPGNGPGSGAGSMTSMSSANQAIAKALQSLQLASEAQAQSMAQQRTLMGDAKGNQLTSNDNQYQTTPVMDGGEIPILEKAGDDEGWGKLPPKLAKDLMEAKRERVSENYRSQVQAYFQAMSNKARTIKK